MKINTIKKVTKNIILLISLTFLSASRYAQEAKVGYLDLKYVFENSSLKNSLYAKYKSQKDKIKAAKTQAEASLAMLKQNLRQLSTMLGYTEFKDEVTNVQKRIAEQESVIFDAQKELKNWESDLMATIFDNLVTVLETLSQEKKLDIILSRKSSVLYGKQELDLSQDAIDLLNEIEERNTSSAK